MTVSTTDEKKGSVVEGKELDKLERQEGKGFDHEMCSREEKGQGRMKMVRRRMKRRRRKRKGEGEKEEKKKRRGKKQKERVVTKPM